MATVSSNPGDAVTLATAQTGNADSTNTADRRQRTGGGAIVITSTIGGTPTVTVNIQGSVDGTAFFNIPYALVATPRTFVLTRSRSRPLSPPPTCSRSWCSTGTPSM